MKFFETSKYHFFKKSIYINLRWIGIIGQLVAVYFVYFFLGFGFNFFISNIVILLGIISNIYLIFVYQKTPFLNIKILNIYSISDNKIFS